MRNNDPLHNEVKSQVAAALAEDIGDGDITALLVPRDALAIAHVVTRQSGIFCGKPWIAETCNQVDPRIALSWCVNDGERVSPNQCILELSGPARSLLTAERTLLNFAQLLSGVATRTRRFVDLIAGSGARLLDTRKTLPGLRSAQKYAVRCGGGENHRMGLFDAYLIKENHIAAAGSIGTAVFQARTLNPGTAVEVEVETLAELDEALEAGADQILLDNFDLDQYRRAVRHTAGGAKLEASGGIDERDIALVAQTGVDFISVGNLTKAVQPLDLSMRFSSTAYGQSAERTGSNP